MQMIRGNGHKPLVSEINVTPLVDVMLVLLIIFMITAPMMTQGVDVDLPETTAKSLRQEENPIVITIDKDGATSIKGTPVNRALIRQQLQKYSPEQKKEPIFLKADKNVPYGNVVEIMADIKSAGFLKLGMITQPSPEKD